MYDENNLNSIFDFNNKNDIKYAIRNIATNPFEVFEEAIQVTISSQKKKLEEIYNKSNDLLRNSSNYNEDNDGKPIENDLEIHIEMSYLSSDHFLFTAYLNSLAEMKIVYLFKSLEITMKSLIHIAYPKIAINDFYKWDTMKNFFNGIDIKIQDIDGYEDITELIKVNNSIKHNETISVRAKLIKEFKHSQTFCFDNLDWFYERIKPRVIIFIKTLGEEIIRNLFEFSDDRIELISKEYKAKMDEKDLKKLADKLLSDI